MVESKTLEQQADFIMKSFDFEKVAQVMRKLDWHWASVTGIPTVNDIKRAARRMLDEIVEDIKDNPDAERSVHGRETCGFRAEIIHGSLLRLTFQITSMEWEEGLDDEDDDEDEWEPYP